MASLPELVFSVLLVAASSALLPTTADKLPPGGLLPINQTIVSSGGVFALGFFSPGRSAARRYVGIWYNNILEKTVVWVANRENPLMDPNGVLTIAADGNIVLLGGKGGLLWSSNASGVHRNASAVLQDDGNLVLREAQGEGEGEGEVFWQSFDHPSCTLLPGMKLRLDRRTGAITRLVSWRAADDPSPGNFSAGIDPNTLMEVRTWRGPEIWARGRMWNGNLIAADYTNVTSVSSIYVPIYEVKEGEIRFSFAVAQGTAMTRLVLDPSGISRYMNWEQSFGNWSVLETFPGAPCDFYNRCGPSGLCNNNSSTTLECSCLRGFVPLDEKGWNRGNFTGGCVRRVPLRCDQGDKFLKLGSIRAPDKFTLIRDVDAERCEAECRRGCNCTAYSYNNVASVGSRTRCLIWAGEMLDLKTDTLFGYELNVKLVQSELDESTQTSGFSRKKKSRLLAITMATVGAVMLSLGILALLLRRRYRRRAGKKEKNSMQSGDTKFSSVLSNGETIELRLLHLRSVLAATDNFSDTNKLGEGGFGTVYKGRLPNGEVVAVKRLANCSEEGLEEFKNEVKLIARLQHKNIVQLLGWCLEEDEKILIYEYLPNRSLDNFIFDSSRAAELDWEKRFSIIKGIAQGLLYLHQLSRLHVVHRDLKTSNILLDDAMNAKISDFGLARIVKGNRKEAKTARIIGTYGYMSPEYALHGHFSEKSDVFSFGVILLEIISGRRSNGLYPYKESLNLLGHAWKLWNEDRWLELMDPSLGDSSPEEEVSRCVYVSLMCVQQAITARPTTSEIVAMLAADNACLQAPQKPAFVDDHDSYLKLSENSSTNYITISATQGR